MVRRYVQWLDGTYIDLASLGPTANLTKIKENQAIEASIAIIKLHALFGTEIVLSDIQIIDSPVILRLFADKQFRAFLDKNQEFLQLIAYPEDRHHPTPDSIARTGLRRARREGWTAAKCLPTEPVQVLARSLPDAGRIDLRKQLRDPNSSFNEVVTKFPEYATLLEGLLRGVVYFTNASEDIVQPPQRLEPENQYSMLRIAAEDSNLYTSGSSRDREYIEKTLHFVESQIENPEERERQSIVFERLEQFFPKGHPDLRIIQNTVHHAWNAAVEYTIEPDGASLGHLPQSAQIGLYLDQPTDLLLPITYKGGKYNIETYRGTAFKIVSWDPAKIPWPILTKIRKEHADSASEFQNALLWGYADEIKETMDIHVRAITDTLVSELSSPIPPRIPGWIWLAGRVVMAFVDPIVGGYISAGTAGAQLTETGIWRALNKGRKYLATNSLIKAATLAKLQRRSKRPQ